MFPLCSGSFRLPSLYKHAPLRLQAGHLRLKHTAPATWNTPKSRFQRKPSRRLFLKRQRQKPLQLVQSSDTLLGMWLNGRFPWRTYFFSLFASVSAKDDFVGSSARSPPLGQRKPKIMFPAPGGSAPLLAALLPGHWPQGTRHLTEIQQRRTSLESNVMSK